MAGVTPHERTSGIGCLLADKAGIQSLVNRFDGSMTPGTGGRLTSPWADWSERWRSLSGVWPILICLVLLLGLTFLDSPCFGGTPETSTAQLTESHPPPNPSALDRVTPPALLIKSGGPHMPSANGGQNNGDGRNPVVRIGVLANRGHGICLAEWVPTADYLSAEIGSKRFEIVPLDFSEVQGAAEQRSEEFLLVNPSLYVALEHQGLVSRIATFQQPSVKGESPLPFFGGVIFRRTDRPDIQTLQDLAGKRFAAVSPESLGGWHAAWREFKRLGLRPDKDFAALGFSGTHDAVVEAVRRGEVDAGTVRSSQLERMALEGTIDLSDFRLLQGSPNPAPDYPFLLSTPLYPEWPFAARKGTDLELAKRVASALLRMSADDPAAKAALGGGWAIPQDYASVHDCLRELNLPPYETYGKLTLRQAVSQYWGFLLTILAIMLTVVILGSLAWRTSVRLKESIRALEESEQKYRGVVENIQDVFYRVDARGQIVLVSPSAARIMGYDGVEDMIGRKAESFWVDSQKRSAFLEELNRSGQVRDWEFEMRRRDGSILTAAASIQQICDGLGNPVGYEGIWWDITDRKRAENILLARLRLSDFARSHSVDELLQQTVDEAEGLTGSRIGFFHFLHGDQSTVILQTWSTTTLRDMCTAEGKGLHYPVERAGVWVDCIRQRQPVIHNDYAGLGHRKGMPPGHPPVIRELVVPIFRGDVIVATLGVGNKPDPYLREDVDAVSQLANLAWDIVLGRQAEEALRQSEERFHSLFSNMAEGVALHELVHDDSGVPVNYRIVDCNPQYEGILGIRCEDVVGKLASEAYGTEDPPFLDEFSRVAVSGVPECMEVHFAPMDRHFEISVAPWGDKGFATIFTDVTARKLAEEERASLERHLLQVQKLESIGQLAGGVAHDLNNMLSPILGYTEMLLLDLPERHSQATELEQILEAAKRARDLTRQLLAFARKQTLEMKALDLNKVVQGLEKMLRRTIREDVSIEMHLSPVIGLFNGDVGQIEQIIVNLAINAQDAMPEGGTLVIETSSVFHDEAYVETHAGATVGRHVLMQVSDTGTGIDQKTLERIFDPFFTTKEMGRGTGLGLSTVYGIVKQHGGNIWVESESGKGTIFHVSFAETSAYSHPEEAGLQATSARGSEMVLIVEDQEQVRIMTREILKRHGYTVLEAPDGETAMTLARSYEGPIDLLITDVIMPGMHGKELYERLRAMRSEIRVLYMSGYPSDVIGYHGVLDADVNFIQKPFTVRDFTNRIREVLD
jgi:PAS domain S-box-containing protein